MKLDWRENVFLMKSGCKLFTPPAGLGGHWLDREIW